jgi:glutathione S-transferase
MPEIIERRRETACRIGATWPIAACTLVPRDRRSQQIVKLYDYRNAPSPRKVRLFMAEKGIQVPTVEVDLRGREQHRPDFLAKNPGATVPTLELDDGTYVTESLAICHYFEQLHPQPNLMGLDAKEQALVLMWHDIQTFEGFLAIQEVLRNSHAAFKDHALGGAMHHAQIPELVERGRRRSEVFFDRIEERLSSSLFVASARFTYADIVGFVYLKFAARSLGHDPAATRPALRRWSDAIAARPAIKAAG